MCGVFLLPLQEVDEAKEATSEVLQRVDDVKRHTAALEGKLESFNTQVGERERGLKRV
jgi:hypothetical protein